VGSYKGGGGKKAAGFEILLKVQDPWVRRGGSMGGRIKKRAIDSGPNEGLRSQRPTENGAQSHRTSRAEGERKKPNGRLEKKYPRLSVTKRVPSPAAFLLWASSFGWTARKGKGKLPWGSEWRHATIWGPSQGDKGPRTPKQKKYVSRPRKSELQKKPGRNRERQKKE